MIGRRLKLARAASGLSLRQLEAKVCNRVSAQTISKYEHDLSLPSSGVLIALASALEVSADFLAGNQELILDCIEFRKKGAAGKRERARVEAMALHLLGRYLVVEEALNLPSVEWDRPGAVPWPVRNGLEEAEHAAASLRPHWNLGMCTLPIFWVFISGKLAAVSSFQKQCLRPTPTSPRRAIGGRVARWEALNLERCKGGIRCVSLRTCSPHMRRRSSSPLRSKRGGSSD